MPKTRLELVRVIHPRDFKSLVSTIPPPGHVEKYGNDVMLLRLCQLKSLRILQLSLLILISCSQLTPEKGQKEVLTTFTNQWFKTNSDHALIDKNGEATTHLFFDLNSEYVASQKEVSVVIATPKGSKHSYDIDLSSGQRYYTHTYCKQDDIWKSFKGTIYRPPFSIGYIPKVLDQLGDSQKVIIWSKTKNIQKTYKTNYQKVRLVGAYVEQNCPVGNCIGKNNWLSKLVFVGVDASDESMASIVSTSDFKNVIDWEESKAYLANMDGLNSIGDIYYPAKRIGELLDFNDAFKYFKKRSIILTNKELKNIQKGCHDLFDLFLEEVSKTQAEDRPAKNIDELKEKLKLKALLKKKKLPIGFAQRLARFTEKYFKEMTTCEKFIYHGNINKNQEDFWFLSYLGIYFKLHREGYFFDCKNQSWRRNEFNEEGQLIFNLQEDIKQCDDRDLDLAMNYLSNFLKGLKSGDQIYKFIDYDNQYQGTHNKIYSWVRLKAPRFDCINNPNQEIIKNMSVTPEDTSWKPREVIDIKDELKIIE